MLLAIRYYQYGKQAVNLARFIKDATSKNSLCNTEMMLPVGQKILVNVIAYCLMPTHIHIVLEELADNSISVYINNILNSYTRYFNVKHNRKGPLWEGPSKKIPINTDEQLMHVTRYIHLNPVTAYIVNKPEEWPYSSYKEYISNRKSVTKICSYEHILDIRPDLYKKFVDDAIVYQRELAHIKDTIS